MSAFKTEMTKTRSLSTLPGVYGHSEDLYTDYPAVRAHATATPWFRLYMLELGGRWRTSRQSDDVFHQHRANSCTSTQTPSVSQIAAVFFFHSMHFAAFEVVFVKDLKFYEGHLSFL